MFCRSIRVGAVLMVLAVSALLGWSQERPRQRGFAFMRMGDQGEYISIVLLLDEATAKKVKAVYEEEGTRFMEALRALRDSAGGDQAALREGFREERKKSAARIREGLKGILSEQQLKDIEPIINARSPRRDAHLWALGSLTLSEDQRTRLLAITVPYAVKMVRQRRMPRQPRGERGAIREEVRQQMEEFQKAVGAILTAEQKKQWEDEAAKIQERWEQERQRFRQRRGGGRG